MASGQGSTQYNRSSFGSQSQQAPVSAPYPSQLPTSMPSMNMGMPLHSEASSQPPPLPTQPQRQQGQQHAQSSIHLQTTSTSGHLSPQSHVMPRQLQPPTHQVSHQGGQVHHIAQQHNGQQQNGHASQPLSHSQAQSHPYPSVNAISGLLPPGSMTGLAAGAPQGHMLHSLQGMHPFPFHGIPGIEGYPPIPGAMPGMQSLMHHSRVDALTQPHHTSSTLPSSQHLGQSLGASLGSTGGFPHTGLLSGAVDKRRNRMRRRSDLAAVTGLKGEDHHAIIMGMSSSKYDPSILLHTSGPSHSQLPEADGVQFKLMEQLPDAKIRRLRDEKIKPIELLSFEDIKAYNRNQLRAYCFVYGIKRKKKADMELNMARYAALFHPGDPAYDITKFEPTKYIDGAIPRRRTPVTKEQKERAAGNSQQLNNTIQRRPQASSSFSHEGYNPHSGQFTLTQPGTAQPPPLPTHPLNHPRIYEMQSGTTHHNQHHHSNGHTQASSPDDVATNGSDMITVHDPLHVSNQLLGLSNQIVDE